MIPDQDDWLGAVRDCAAAEIACVLVTLVEVEGSAPREGGAKMVVASDRQIGSIGGGHLEHRAGEIARALISEGARGPRLERLALGPQLGQCCGGRVVLLFEPFAPRRFTVALFGAGHVGKALVAVLGGLPIRLIWIDQRADQFPTALPTTVEMIVAEFPADEVADLPAGAHALVMTHSHDLDLAICERLLKRDDLGEIGLIGSGTKRARFASRLLAKGLPEARVRALKCPIGIAGVGAKHPPEIAIAVAAELLALKSRAEAAHADPSPARQHST